MNEIHFYNARLYNTKYIRNARNRRLGLVMIGVPNIETSNFPLQLRNYPLEVITTTTT
jgi:hypothetical protein